MEGGKRKTDRYGVREQRLKGSRGKWHVEGLCDGDGKGQKKGGSFSESDCVVCGG